MISGKVPLLIQGTLLGILDLCWRGSLLLGFSFAYLNIEPIVSKSMTLHISVPGKPVGTNNAYRRRGNGSGFFLTKDAVAFKERLKAYAIKAVIEQRWKKPTLKQFCEVDITVWNAPRFDADSPTKFCLDSLQGCVYENDKCVSRVSSGKEQDNGDPRVEIKVTMLEG